MAPLLCPSCGSEIRNLWGTARFCGECGKPLATVEPGRTRQRRRRRRSVRRSLAVLALTIIAVTAGVASVVLAQNAKKGSSAAPASTAPSTTSSGHAQATTSQPAPVDPAAGAPPSEFTDAAGIKTRLHVLAIERVLTYPGAPPTPLLGSHYAVFDVVVENLQPNRPAPVPLLDVSRNGACTTPDCAGRVIRLTQSSAGPAQLRAGAVVPPGGSTTILLVAAEPLVDTQPPSVFHVYVTAPAPAPGSPPSVVELSQDGAAVSSA